MRCRRSADSPDVDCGAVVAVRLKPDTTGRVMLPDSSTNRTTMREIEALITPPQQHPAASAQSTRRRQCTAPYGVSSMLRRRGELRELAHRVPVATRAA